jgi:hypothetical protein
MKHQKIHGQTAPKMPCDLMGVVKTPPTKRTTPSLEPTMRQCTQNKSCQDQKKSKIDG